MKRTHAVRPFPALRPLSDDALTAVSGAAPSVSEIVVTKTTDTASPKLFQACCSGRHFDEAKLVL